MGTGGPRPLLRVWSSVVLFGRDVLGDEGEEAEVEEGSTVS